jgi:hypothetical protein
MASDLRAIRGYFPSLRHYRRWLLTVAYREALRAGFLHPDVAALLEHVSADERVILRYLYLDQMTGPQLVTALGLGVALQTSANAPGRGVDRAAQADAEARGLAAYKALCEHLRGAGWARQTMQPFPAYPAFPSVLPTREV